jgi:phosphoglycerol transferase
MKILKLMKKSSLLYTLLSCFFIIVVITLLLLRLYNLDSRGIKVPFKYNGDTVSLSIQVKNAIEGDWFFTTDRVGAPFGYNNYDFPQSDFFHLLLLKIITFFSKDFGTVLNLYYLLSFYLISFAVFFVLKKLKVSDELAVSGSIIYSILPYHLFRGLGHLFLSSYYIIPLFVYVLIILYKDKITKRNLISILLITLILSLSGVYYSFFCVIFLFIEMVFFIIEKNFRKVAVIISLVGVILFLIPCSMFQHIYIRKRWEI